MYMESCLSQLLPCQQNLTELRHNLSSVKKVIPFLSILSVYLVCLHDSMGQVHLDHLRRSKSENLND